MIDNDTYKNIHKLMPICCIDTFILYKGGLLFVKRANQPAMGQWWTVGGRIRKNEKFVDAATRLMLAEVGLCPLKLQIMGVSETIFPEDPFSHGQGTHTVNVIFKALARDRDIPRLDSSSTEVVVIKPEDLRTFGLPENLLAFALNIFGQK